MDIWGKIIPGRENSKYKDAETVEVLGMLEEQQGGHHVCCSINKGRVEGDEVREVSRGQIM